MKTDLARFGGRIKSGGGNKFERKSCMEIYGSRSVKTGLVYAIDSRGKLKWPCMKKMEMGDKRTVVQNSHESRKKN